MRDRQEFINDSLRNKNKFITQETSKFKVRYPQVSFLSAVLGISLRPKRLRKSGQKCGHKCGRISTGWNMKCRKKLVKEDFAMCCHLLFKRTEIEDFHFLLFLCFKIDHVIVAWNAPLSICCIESGPNSERFFGTPPMQTISCIHYATYNMNHIIWCKPYAAYYICYTCESLF